MAWMQHLWPGSLKNRLFVSVLLFVLVPFSLFQIRNIDKLEFKMQSGIAEQNAAQLEFLKDSFESLKLEVFAAMLQLERQPELRSRLMAPEHFPVEERELFLRNKLLTTKHALMNGTVPLHITMMDMHGHIYTTMTENLEQQTIAADDILGEPEFLRFNQSDEPYFWSIHDPKDLLVKEFPHARLYSFYAKLENIDKTAFGYLRFSLDISAWLSSITNGFQVKQSYYIMDGDGNPVLQTDESWGEAGMDSILPRFRENPEAFFTDSRNHSLYNSVYLPHSGWYLINRFPLEALSGSIRDMKRQLAASFSVTVCLFAGITFAIASAISRPLRSLELRMRELVERNLNVHLPEERYKGESRMLARAFNRMTDDIRGLITRLKAEERQKEAIRFQMLMSQMNPHFLLNTLNTIKWNARNHGDAGTSEICQSLGRLLECSLNTDVDLVHLREEIELVEAYVHIQSFRYDHTFEVRYEVGEDVHYALVPKLSLQPLVENSIYHGLVHMNRGGTISIRAFRLEGMLRLEIEDNGQGTDSGASGSGLARKRKGIGLGNLRERLQLLYKGDARLRLQPLEQGMLVQLDIPLLVSSPYGKEHQHVENSSG
ncbi:MAG: putative rane protein [Paenibacillaceae bacterium]|nr:putative rane protein [Paenibacillaceae bacterium]